MQKLILHPTSSLDWNLSKNTGKYVENTNTKSSFFLSSSKINQYYFIIFFRRPILDPKIPLMKVPLDTMILQIDGGHYMHVWVVLECDLYYHTFARIRHFFHPNHVNECSSTIPPMSSRDFIHRIMCPRQDGKTHYLRQCVEGSCNNCGGISLWSDCIHESEDQAFRNAIVQKQNY